MGSKTIRTVGALVAAVCLAASLGSAQEDAASERAQPQGQQEAGPKHFYYCFEEKIPLELSTERIGVRFEPAVSMETKESVLAADTALESIDGAELPSGLQMIRLRAGLTEEDVLAAEDRLWDQNAVRYACPVFKYREAELAPGEQFRVKFEPGVSQEEIDEINALHGVTVIRKHVSRLRRRGTIYTMQVVDPRARNGMEMANLYQEDARVYFAVPSWLTSTVQLCATPDDTYFSDQWQLHNGSNPDINAPAAWDAETGSSSIVIAVVDTGVYATNLFQPTCTPHEDLNVWGNAAEIAGTEDYDDDENGYEDDFHGWNFVYPLRPAPLGNNPVDDQYSGHGTSVAGIAGAIADNSTGVAGVVWGATIMPVKILQCTGTPPGLSWWGSSDGAANGIEYAVDNGAHVVNCSWKLTSPDPDVTIAIESAEEGRDGKGSVVVFAAGNDSLSTVAIPANHGAVIGVGATDDQDELFYYSNCGPEMDVVAPSGTGVGQESTVTLYTTDYPGFGGGNRYRINDEGPFYYTPEDENYRAYFSGTSGAAPFVSGLAGLLIAYNSNLTDDQIQVIIQASAKDLGDAGRDNTFGFGRIDADAALDFAASPPHVMTLKDANGAEAMHIDAVGDVDIDGNLVQNATSQQLTESSSDLWLFKDGANVVARVDSGRNLYLKGTLSQREHTLTPTSASYIWEYDSGDVGDVVGFIDENGNLKLRGTATSGS